MGNSIRTERGSKKEGLADQGRGDIVQQQYRYGAEIGKGAVLYASWRQ